MKSLLEGKSPKFLSSPSHIGVRFSIASTSLSNHRAEALTHSFQMFKWPCGMWPSLQLTQILSQVENHRAKRIIME